MLKNKNNGIESVNSRALVVYLLISVNMVVYIILNLHPELREVLLLDTQSFEQTPWTLITVFFSQENFFHLLVNTGLLFIFGRNLENIIGGKNILIIYMLAGFLGSLSIIPYVNIIKWTGTVAGASAATFGISATYAAINPDKMILKGKAKHWALSLFIVNIVISISNPEMSIAAPAHSIGLIVGVIYGLCIKKSKLIKYD